MSSSDSSKQKTPRQSLAVAVEQCEIAGHVWVAAGGGLLECALCGAERWADDEVSDAP